MDYRIPQHCPHRPRSTENPPRAHDLDITKYTFDDILGIFSLGRSISLDDMKRAKKKVLMSHPDKSRLPPDYFRFYAKAYEIVYSYYMQSRLEEASERQLAEGAHNQYAYSPPSAAEEKPDLSFDVSQFNRIFDEKMRAPVDESRNAWFKTEQPIYQVEGVVNQANMGAHFERVKQQQGVVLYRGVQEMRSAMGNRLYEEEAEGDDVYIDSDPFSKLRFEDLRKVHKDQTVFHVSESQAPTTKMSMEDYRSARTQQNYTYVSGDELERRAQMEKARMDEIRHRDVLRGLEYERKQKEAMAHFLRLGR